MVGGHQRSNVEGGDIRAGRVTSRGRYLGDAGGGGAHVLPVHQDVHRVIGAAPHPQTVPNLAGGGNTLQTLPGGPLNPHPTPGTPRTTLGTSLTPLGSPGPP